MNHIESFRRHSLVAIAFGAIVAAIAPPAFAQAGGDLVHACVHKASKRLRIVAPGESCNPGERPLTWGIEGPPGPPGPVGPIGPAGPPGSPGDAAAPPKPNVAAVGSVTVVVGGGGIPDFTFDILGHAWTEEAVVFHSGGGGPSHGIPKFKPMELVKAIDAATPVLMGIISRGNHVDKVTVDLAPAAGDPGSLLRYELDDVLLTLDHHASTGVEGDAPLESLSLEYDKIEITFTGAGGGGASFCWDVANNLAC